MLLTVDLTKLQIVKGQVLLDAGCGEGRHCEGALELGAKVVGFDLNSTALTQAATRLLGKTNGSSFLKANALTLPFTDESFDRIICSEVMEHVENYKIAITELYRVIKPGGRIAVTIPTEPTELLYLALSTDYFETPGGHIRIFKPRTLALSLQKAGFIDITVGFAHAFHSPYWALRCLVGLSSADQNKWVILFRKLLLEATRSLPAQRIEKLFNYVFPKSLVLYGRRRDST